MTANSNPNRLLTLLASAMIAGFVGDAALSAPPALAQAGVTNANLTDPTLLLAPRQNAPVATLTDDRPARFSQTTPAPDDPDAEAPRQIELELQAPSSITGGLDILAQRASIGTDRTGELNRRGRGSEVRVGRSLGDPTSGATRGGDGGRIYSLPALTTKPLTWQPGGSPIGGGIAARPRRSRRSPSRHHLRAQRHPSLDRLRRPRNLHHGRPNHGVHQRELRRRNAHHAPLRRGRLPTTHHTPRHSGRRRARVVDPEPRGHTRSSMIPWVPALAPLGRNDGDAVTDW